MNTDGHTAAITNVQLLPRLGQAQLVKVDILVDDTTALTCEMVLRDLAFEEFNLFGAPKNVEEKSKDRRARQGEF